MTTSSPFELDLDAFDDFDPLADTGLDDDEELEFPVGDGSNLKAAGAETPVRPVPAHDLRPAAERTAELFASMPTRRKTLLAILAYCDEPRPVADVAQYIDELKQRDRSVFTAADLTALLERAGAVERVDESGAPYQDVTLEPKTVVIDGVEYLEPATPPVACWLATEAGRAVLEGNRPAEALQALFEEEGAYLAIYKRVLTLASDAQGATAKQLARAIDSDPLLKSPRYYSSRFVEKLNQCDALSWEGKVWMITAVGREALDQLAGVDDPASDAIAANLNA